LNIIHRAKVFIGKSAAKRGREFIPLRSLRAFHFPFSAVKKNRKGRKIHRKERMKFLFV